MLPIELAPLVYTSAMAKVSHDTAVALVQAWCGEACASNCNYISKGLPYNLKGTGVHKQFFDEFVKAYTLNQEIINYLPDISKGIVVARKDDAGYWVLFNPITLDYTYIYLEVIDYIPVESLIPTKVYVSLPQAGSYIGMTTLTKVLEEFSRVEVNEVHFTDGFDICTSQLEIAQLCSSLNLNYNIEVTTLSWLKEKGVEFILDKVGRLYFHVKNSAAPIAKLAMLLKRFLASPKVVISYSLHYYHAATFKAIVEQCATYGYALHLLGNTTSSWLDHIKQMGELGTTITIDDDVVHNYNRAVMFNQLSDVLVPLNKGKFSCYVDIQTLTIGGSRYWTRQERVAFTEDWVSNYQKF